MSAIIEELRKKQVAKPANWNWLADCMQTGDQLLAAVRAENLVLVRGLVNKLISCGCELDFLNIRLISNKLESLIASENPDARLWLDLYVDLENNELI